jgi:hypothetical protein
MTPCVATTQAAQLRETIESNDEIYLDCRIIPTIQPIDDGFVANLVIESETGSHVFHSIICTETAGESLRYARQWGRRWVDDRM